MIICKHCHAEVSTSAEICPACGCYLEDKFVLTLKRENQFMLWNPKMQIVITGSKESKNVSVENGETIQLRLTPDKYLLNATASVAKATCSVTLDQNRTIRLAWNRFKGGLEMWEI